jgi:electron transport complex protein RnfG
VRSYWRLTIVLAVISAAASGLLVLVNSFTAPKIFAYQAQAEADAYRQVLPQAERYQSLSPAQLAKLRTNPETAGISNVKAGIKAGRPVGWVCKVVSHGYSSDIKLLVGIGQDARLTGVVILEQSETPGLGSEVTGAEFIRQAALKKADPQQDLQVNKDGGTVQAVAGATISSRAVVHGINQAFRFFRSRAADSGPGAATTRK